VRIFLRDVVVFSPGTDLCVGAKRGASLSGDDDLNHGPSMTLVTISFFIPADICFKSYST
jgi:hypothetical protein